MPYCSSPPSFVVEFYWKNATFKCDNKAPPYNDNEANILTNNIWDTIEDIMRTDLNEKDSCEEYITLCYYDTEGEREEVANIYISSHCSGKEWVFNYDEFNKHGRREVCDEWLALFADHLEEQHIPYKKEGMDYYMGNN